MAGAKLFALKKASSMALRFWFCATITTISALVSAGFSVVGLLGPPVELTGVKRTSRKPLRMSDYDPKRTYGIKAFRGA
jgi:hypothetical protein